MTDAEAKECRERLHKLWSWGRCFIEDTPITAETLWREFPRAMLEAKEFLEKTK